VRLSWYAAVLCIALPRPAPAQSFSQVDAAIRDGIAQRIYPGAVVVVGRSDTILYARGYGHFTWSSSSASPDPATTRWDLASLTKIVATTGALAVLVQQHRVDLDAPVSRYVPGFTGGRKNQVTVRMLLAHTSGMPPYIKFWISSHTPAEALQQLLITPLAGTPGAKPVYSDLNGMLAGLVVEHASHQALDRFADSAVFSPLGMTSTGYRPDKRAQADAAPTGLWHGHPVGGTVNDRNAATFGGVSGHAGVFSTGLDLARFDQGWLKGAAGHGKWLKESTVSEFLSHTATSGTRVLGWDTPLPPGGKKVSLYGRCATPTTFGHTGWTGTEMWIDPANNLFVVFLTNRAFDPARPEASFVQLKEIRLRVADAVRAALGQCRM
jgi:CubicO group peptidase (beta-lactamase class C family)